MNKSLNPLPSKNDQFLQGKDLPFRIVEEIHYRWQHISVMHRTWGIASGLEVMINDKEIIVEAGLAYDWRGRELQLSGETKISLPDENQFNHDLVISYQETKKPSLNRTLLAWRKPDEVDLGQDIRLIRISGNPRKVTFNPNFRQYAKLGVKNYVASGRTPPDQQWNTWGHSNKQVGWNTYIDTSRAGFSLVPTYFAQLVEDPFQYTDVLRPSFGPFTSIMNSTPYGFTFTVVAIYEKGGTGNLFFVSPPQVSWIGVEPSIPYGAQAGSCKALPVGSIIS